VLQERVSVPGACPEVGVTVTHGTLLEAMKVSVPLPLLRMSMVWDAGSRPDGCGEGRRERREGDRRAAPPPGSGVGRCRSGDRPAAPSVPVATKSSGAGSRERGSTVCVKDVHDDPRCC